MLRSPCALAALRPALHCLTDSPTGQGEHSHLLHRSPPWRRLTLASRSPYALRMAGRPLRRARLEAAAAVARGVPLTPEQQALAAHAPAPAVVERYRPAVPPHTLTPEERRKGTAASRERAAERRAALGRPLAEVASLADRAAVLVLARDVRTLESKTAEESAKERAANRVAVLCRGRVPALVSHVAEGGAGAAALASVLDEATRALLRSLRARLPRAAGARGELPPPLLTSAAPRPGSPTRQEEGAPPESEARPLLSPSALPVLPSACLTRG